MTGASLASDGGNIPGGGREELKHVLICAGLQVACRKRDFGLLATCGFDLCAETAAHTGVDVQVLPSNSVGL